MEASDATGIPLQEEQPERDDWVEIRRRRSKKVKPQNTEATISVSQPTPQRALTRQPRLPPLPRDDFKIIIRPRGALNLANLETIHLSRAIAEKTRQHTRDRPNSTTFQVRMDRIQNIAIASTPSEDLARHIRDIPTLRFGDNEYEVTAYIAAPDDSARGVVRGIPPETTGQELIDNLYSPGYEILSARMIGKTSTALITFTGKQLPKYVIFEHAALPCSWYLPTRHACYICHEIGHRADVCPNPDTVKCVMCGVSNPTKGHECTPRCALCTGAHPTGSKECPKKLAHRPPTSVSNHHRRRKDTRVNSRSRSRSRGPQRTGPRQRSSSRPRSNSRSRSSNPQCDKAPAALCQPTDNNRVSWAARLFPQNNQKKQTTSSSSCAPDVSQKLTEILNQLKELRAENQQLKEESRQLREENRQLRTLLTPSRSSPPPDPSQVIPAIKPQPGKKTTSPVSASDEVAVIPEPTAPMPSQIETGLGETLVQSQQQMQQQIIQIQQQMQLSQEQSQQQLQEMKQALQHLHTLINTEDTDHANRKKAKLVPNLESPSLPTHTPGHDE